MDGWIGPRDAHTSACGKGEGRGGCSDANGVLRARPRMDGRCGGGEQPRGLWIDSMCWPVSTDPPARCTGRGRTSQAPSARTRHGRARENGRRCCSLLACCLLPAHTHMRTPQAGGRGEEGGGRCWPGAVDRAVRCSIRQALPDRAGSEAQTASGAETATMFQPHPLGARWHPGPAASPPCHKQHARTPPVARQLPSGARPSNGRPYYLVS